MSRIKPVNHDTVDTRIAVTLQAVKKKLGVLPNMFATFAQSPVALQGYVQLNQCLSSGVLSPRQRELIALAVAQENACEYCLSAHAMLGKQVGLSEENIEAARAGRAQATQDNLITRFALKLAQSRAEIGESELASMRQAGLDDGLMVEIIANVALNVMTNYLNKVAETEIDFPVVSLEQVA